MEIIRFADVDGAVSDFFFLVKLITLGQTRFRRHFPSVLVTLGFTLCKRKMLENELGCSKLYLPNGNSIVSRRNVQKKRVH